MTADRNLHPPRAAALDGGAPKRHGYGGGMGNNSRA